MNIAPLRRVILKEAGYFLIAIAIAGTLTVYLDIMHERYTVKRLSAISEVNLAAAEKKRIEDQFDTVTKKMPLFYASQAYEKRQGLFIDSQAVRDLFNTYQSRYFLKKMSVEMQPIADLTAEAHYAHKHFLTARTSIKATIEALADDDIYRMMQMMQRELPGFVRIHRLSMQKNQDLSKDSLAAIRKDGAIPLVSAEMSFDWFGMKSTDENSPLNKYIPKNPEGSTP